jgi:hypothetical protein
MNKKCLAVLWLIFPLISLSEEYYNLPCEDQAADIKEFAKFRDSGWPQQKLEAHVSENYNKAHTSAHLAHIKSVYTLKSRSPSQLYQSSLNDCQNRGRAPEENPLYSSDVAPRGVLSDKQKDRCVEQHDLLNSSRKIISAYEIQLEELSNKVKVHYETISTKPSPSEIDISRYNNLAAEFGLKIEEYNLISSKFNDDTESFKIYCGGIKISK